MDLKVFYKKIRQIEAAIVEPDVVIVSLETPDGGRAGIRTEVPRALAARMVSQGCARLAEEKEASEFYKMAAEAKLAVDRAAEAKRVQFTLVPDTEPRIARSSSKSSKK